MRLTYIHWRLLLKKLFFAGLLGSLLVAIGLGLYLRPWTWKQFDLPEPDAPFTKTVEIRQEGDAFSLFRHGKRFHIKGAGGQAYLDKLKESGGNCIRTWSSINLDSILDHAHEQELSVIVGLNVIPARYGLDYRNPRIVKTQWERIRRDVRKYKDHPALLMWAVGNELELDCERDEPFIWRAVNDLAKMIHEEDPDHPTTLMIMPSARRTRAIAELAPEIDVLSFNVFGGLTNFPEKIRRFWWGWNGPYLISEWGALGWWEVKQTQWQAPQDMHSKGKMQKMDAIYESSVAKDTTRCLGSFVFYWGLKQERTHTWFSMFLETGEKTPLVDLMTYKWTKKWPENRSPLLDSLAINGELYNNTDVYLHLGEMYEASVSAFDEEGDSLYFKWEILPEGNYFLTTGGDKEARPHAVEGLIEEQRGRSIRFRAPDEPGPYRLFVYAYDGNEGGAFVDKVFFVTHHAIN